MELLGAIHRLGERRGARGQRHVVEAARERVPVGVGHLARRNSLSAARANLRKRIGVQLIERHTDDAAAGDEAGARQVQQAGYELAAREIARSRRTARPPAENADRRPAGTFATVHSLVSREHPSWRRFYHSPTSG